MRPNSLTELSHKDSGYHLRSDDDLKTHFLDVYGIRPLYAESELLLNK